MVGDALATVRANWLMGREEDLDSPRLAGRGAPLALGVAAVALAVAVVANSVGLPFGLDRLGGLTLGAALAAGLTVLIWPELALPVIVTAAGLLDSRFGGERVRHLVFVKLALFGCAALGLALSGLRRPGRFSRVRTPADLPALLLVIYTAASAGYGYLVAGHDLNLVAVAGYHLSQVALYHFAVTTSLGKPEAYRRAGVLIIAWSLLWIVPSLAMSGRGGGTATTWLIVLLCYAVAANARWRALVWLALPLALLDTLTSGYRTLWLAVTGQLGWLAGLRGPARRLGAVAAVLLLVGLMGAVLALSRPGLLQAIPSADTLSRFATSVTDGGYRVPEAAIGLDSFRGSPVFGRGVGYQTIVRWVETMGYMPVGPIHHVYYISYLSNEGLVGLMIVLWYFAAALLSGPARRLRQQAADHPWAAAGVALQAALFGAVLGAFFAGPSDGHWTWGVFGAASLLPAMWGERTTMSEHSEQP